MKIETDSLTARVRRAEQWLRECDWIEYPYARKNMEDVLDRTFADSATSGNVEPSLPGAVHSAMELLVRTAGTV